MLHSATLSCPTPCSPIDCSPPGSSVYGILPVRMTAVGCHFFPPRDLPDPGVKPASLMFPVLAARFFTTSATCEAQIDDLPKEDTDGKKKFMKSAISAVIKEAQIKTTMRGTLIRIVKIKRIENPKCQ